MLPRVLLLGVVAAIALAGWLATWGAWRYSDAVRDLGPIQTRTFEQPTLVLLGTGGETENPSRLGPAIGFGSGETVVIVDAGRGVAESLRRASIALAQPSGVLLTSLLPENTVGLDDLLASGWRAGREQPLRLVGPPGTRALAEAVEASLAPSVAALSGPDGPHAGGARFRVEEITGAWTGTAGDVRLSAALLEGGPLPAQGYRLEAEGRAVVIAGADRDPEALATLAERADAIVHGAVFADSVKAAIEAGADAARLEHEASLQISLRELAQAAQRAHALHLVLVRLRPPPLFDFQFEQVVGEHYDGSVVVAHDGDELTL